MNDVTRLLVAIEEGDERATDQLLPLVYQELRVLAAAKPAKERPDKSLQPTMLVHDAYLLLVDLAEPQKWQDLEHFLLPRPKP